MKRITLYTLSALLIACSGGEEKKETTANARPKLVIGIVVDQMRYDYLERFWDRYSDDGFKKLVNQGYSCNNLHYNYMPTYTAPGHASIYTGTTPSNHGIISNSWYSKKKHKKTYCTSDKKVEGLGTATKNGKMSPKRLLATTITDELKATLGDDAKVIGISIKDRGAILPAGHKGNLALWFEGDSAGNWISSSYYGSTLPEWVQQLNANDVTSDYLNGEWNTLYPIETYTASMEDDNNYEIPFETLEAPIFPYKLNELLDSNNYKSLIKSTPFGNTILKDLAIAAIENEQLGQDAITDFLAISFSSTDYIGHQFGPNAVEIEDTYLRLDKDLANFIDYVEKTIGKENVLLFLTADHGAVPVPQLLMDTNEEGGYFETKKYGKELQGVLKEKYGSEELIENISNFQVFLNHNEIQRLKVKQQEIEDLIVKYFASKEGVAYSMTVKTLMSDTRKESTPLANALNGYHKERSGDILFVLKHGWIEEYGGDHRGTTHGSPYNYDTHVPLIWYGSGIENGKSERKMVIPDIAATLSKLLHIGMPSDCTGEPITEIVDQ